MKSKPVISSRECKRITILGAIAVCLFFLGAPLHVHGQAQPKDTVILKGAPMGGVKFEHKLHVERAANKCDVCHHASKPQKPSKQAQEACDDCHTKPPQAGMKTVRQAAYHNPTAKSGTCLDCHIKDNAAGKKSPVKCTECHKKENA
jgi:hypothetical protein